MYTDQMITRLGEFSTLLEKASEEKQRNFFRDFLAVHSSLQNPQTQAQAVTALNTQVSEILGVNNNDYQVINTTEALLNLANLQNLDTANLIALADSGALHCAASFKLMDAEDLNELLGAFFLTPQQQALQSFTTIIDRLIALRFVIQHHFMTTEEVVNSVLTKLESTQSSCAAAPEPITPRITTKKKEPETPDAPSRRPSPVELPPLPQAMLQALAELFPLPLPFPFSLFARRLDDQNNNSKKR